MDSGYKHFSHEHNLIIHESHEAAYKSCSGCHSSVTGTAYTCWQCNFILHEQCFLATRSLKHPSHLSHPLTLVPYPTYPSKSFDCSSCNLFGDGLSYSCSECEFDLHVHCAYSNSYASDHGQDVVPQSGHNSYPAELESESDRERIKKNERRLEIAREEYRLEALGRQYALDLI